MIKENQKEVKGALYKGITVILAGLGILSCSQSAQPGMQGRQAVEYAIDTLEVTRVSLNASHPAMIQGIQDVEIRPRVSGFITKLYVDEGAFVTKGQPLFQIDQVPYEAAVNAAEAAVKMAEANVATAQLTYDNKKNLAAQNIIGAYDLETALNTFQTQKANLAQAQAQLRSARNDLSYTTVTSPSAGVVGTLPFRVGSLVSSTSMDPLTVVSDISQMYIYFSLDEKELLDMTRQDGSSMHKTLNAMPKVELLLADGTIYPDKGTINAVSGVIDKSTGAVQVRAVFPNKEKLLRSGGSGKILIPTHRDSVFRIPQKATYELQDKKYVYLVSDSSTAVTTEIKILPLNDGQSYVVTEGLLPGQRIIIEGIASLRNGTPITPISKEESRQRIEASKKAMQQSPAANQKK